MRLLLKYGLKAVILGTRNAQIALLLESVEEPAAELVKFILQRLKLVKDYLSLNFSSLVQILQAVYNLEGDTSL